MEAMGDPLSNESQTTATFVVDKSVGVPDCVVFTPTKFDRDKSLGQNILLPEKVESTNNTSSNVDCTILILMRVPARTSTLHHPTSLKTTSDILKPLKGDEPATSSSKITSDQCVCVNDKSSIKNPLTSSAPSCSSLKKQFSNANRGCDVIPSNVVFSHRIRKLGADEFENVISEETVTFHPLITPS